MLPKCSISLTGTVKCRLLVMFELIYLHWVAFLQQSHIRPQSHICTRQLVSFPVQELVQLHCMRSQLVPTVKLPHQYKRKHGHWPCKAKCIPMSICAVCWSSHKQAVSVLVEVRAKRAHLQSDICWQHLCLIQSVQTFPGRYYSCQLFSVTSNKDSTWLCSCLGSCAWMWLRQVSADGLPCLSLTSELL